jgi:hypothetical protein
MADRGVTITSLPPVSNATANDLLVIVRNPSSSGNTSKIAFKNVFSSVDSNIIPTVNTSYNLGTATKQWGNVFASAVRSGGNVTITSVGNTWTFDSNGSLTIPGLLIAPQTTKASGDAGSAGQVCWDADYIYVCTATNTWKRATLNSY